KGGFDIIVSSIPYQVNKSELIIKMADLVNSKKIEGIRDIRDESDREHQVRIVIELKTGVNPQNILNNLYKYTDIERTFNFNMIALVDGVQPQVLRLKEMLQYFIDHRDIVIRRRTQFDLNKALDREHILEGLKKALDHIDAIIKTIRASQDKDDAHKQLVAKFKFSDKQASAILEMKLQSLANLERQRVEDELKEKQKLIKELRALLADPKRILGVVKDELVEIRNKYADARRTKVVARAAKVMSMDDLVPAEEQVMVLTKGGYIKRTDTESYKAQKRGGSGVIDIDTKDEDFVNIFLTVNTHDDLLFFSDKGKVYQIKMYELPEGKRATKGKSIMNFLSLTGEERITSALVMPKEGKNEEKFLVMVTKKGVVKKSDAANFKDVRRSGIVAIGLDKDDELKFVNIAMKGDLVIMATKNGQSITFKESDVRSMGRTAGGVRGISMDDKDEVVGADVVQSEKDFFLLNMGEKGYGKKTEVKNYRVQKRGGSGIKTFKVTDKTGKLMVSTVVGPETKEMIAISQKGQVIRTSLDQVPVIGRQTQGVRIMRLKDGDKIASLTCL
ncbi:MAG: gyrase subunit A protein, partial [Parcubacteria group bacterium GW2011_GWC2_40_31]